MKTFVLILAILSSITCFAQKGIKVYPTKYKSQNVEKIIRALEGEGVIILKVKTNQDSSSNQLARFEDKRGVLGMSSGILMSTGSVSNVGKRSTSGAFTGFTTGKINKKAKAITDASTVYSTKKPGPGDKDLENDLGGTYQTYDACVVEFDLIPLGDTLSFKYLFGSDEYDEYVCSQFNDAFGFYLSGPGIEGIKNVAVLENGSKVNVNSINNGNALNSSCEPSNPSYYVKNNGKIKFEYDGYTRILAVKQKVIPFRRYHLKLVISDVGDGILDSGVFTESESLISYNHVFTVHFDTDVSELSSEAREILKGMAKLSENHPEYIVELTGHTDGVGSANYNFHLAQKRVDSVVEFLKENGFDTDNMLKINKGETMPFATNLTKQGRTKNRRVEIRLIPSINTSSHLKVNLQDSLLSQGLDVSCYPNPANNYFVVEVDEFKKIENLRVIIHKLSGELVATSYFKENMVKFNTESWSIGMYSYRIVSNGSVLRDGKFVVSH